MSADPKFEIIKSHLDADTDSGITAIHHTLGHGAFQASPGSHRHDGTDSHKIKMSDLTGISVTYQPVGGTSGTQPTFSGPAISGSYSLIGSLCHFQIAVDFDNILTFGTGQYYVTLPFIAEHSYHMRDGCLHDISNGRQYTISGHVFAGSATLQLFSASSAGLDNPFEYNVPITLTSDDNFHIAGTYEIQV